VTQWTFARDNLALGKLVQWILALIHRTIGLMGSMRTLITTMVHSSVCS